MRLLLQGAEEAEETKEEETKQSPLEPEKGRLGVKVRSSSNLTALVDQQEMSKL